MRDHLARVNKESNEFFYLGPLCTSVVHARLLGMADNRRASFLVGISVFVIRDGKVLLGKRKHVDGDGSWALPGGHLEDKEAMKYTAARELEEETGLRAEGFDFLFLVNNYDRDQHYLQVSFLAQGVTGEPQLKEPDLCYEWRWFELSNLPEPIFFGHEKVVAMYLAHEGPFAEA